MSRPISRFNPQRMTEDEVLSLSTGRDNILQQMLADMQVCLHPNSNQHFIFYGPRGIGKSFFTRLLKIKHDRSTEFKKSLFIQLPEEQSNISFVADLMDMISTKLEGKLFESMSNRWDIDEAEWQKSKKRLSKSIEQIKKTDKIEHVFFTMENLQDFIPKLSSQENGRMRELLSDYPSLTLIGSSLHPDIDNDYSKKLFQVFKKIDLKPWTEKDYITYYRKKAKFKGAKPLDEEKMKLSEHRIRAIANFTGGSPRLAVILNSLILKDDILSTLEIMNGIIDELTPYYQDLTKDIPNRSKILFDSLIRLGENITQSQLAAGLQPPQEQKTIAKSFSWLTDNFYVNSIKQKSGNVKHYFVRDRLYVLYYQNREIMADQKFSFVETFVEFLSDFYNQQELKDHLQKIDENHFLSKELLFAYIKKIGIELTEECSLLQLKEAIAQYEGDEFEISEILKLVKEKKYTESINILKENEIKLKEDPFYWSCIAMLYTFNKNYELAIKHFKKVIKLNPKAASNYADIGFAYFKIQKYNLAINNNKKCIELDIKNTKAYKNLGKIYHIKEKYQEAIKFYLKTIEIDPDDTDSYMAIGSVYFEIENYDKAIEFFKKAIKLNSSEWDTHYALGIVYNSIQKYSLALNSLKIALTLKQDESLIYQSMGYAYFNLLDYENAEKNIIKAYEIQPKNKEYKKNVIQLYINLDYFEKITKLLIESKDDQRNGVMIANSTLELIDEDRVENFHLFMKVINWIVKDNINWLVPFTSSLTSALYIKKEYELLRDILDELSTKSETNSSLQILIQTWQYVLNPENGDLAALHPDARIAVKAILEVE